MGVKAALYGGVYKSVCAADHPSGFDLRVGCVAGPELSPVARIAPQTPVVNQLHQFKGEVGRGGMHLI